VDSFGLSYCGAGRVPDARVPWVLRSAPRVHFFFSIFSIFVAIVPRCGCLTKVFGSMKFEFWGCRVYLGRVTDGFSMGYIFWIWRMALSSGP
jgi:hypothetical protein